MRRQFCKGNLNNTQLFQINGDNVEFALYKSSFILPCKINVNNNKMEKRVSVNSGNYIADLFHLQQIALYELQ